MVCKGNLVNNREIFRRQWGDYEAATGLRDSKIGLPSLRSVVGKDCLQICLNLDIPDKDRNNIQACLTTLENYSKPHRNVVYEQYVFNTRE